MYIDPKILADYLMGKIIIGFLGIVLAGVLLIVLGIIFLLNQTLFFILVAILATAYFGIQYRLKYHSDRICRDAAVTLNKFIDNYLTGFQRTDIPSSDVEALSEIIAREGINVPSSFILTLALNKAVEQKRLQRFTEHLRSGCPSMPEKPSLYEIIDAYLKMFGDNLYEYFDLLVIYVRELGIEVKERYLLKMIVKEADVRRVSKSIDMKR